MLPQLPSRSESVLKTLIEAYLVDGEPVGSRLISKRFPEAVSSATIRNVLADLEEESLVAQPHTSAGRVPTEKAYRYYVDRWVKHGPPAPDLGAQLSATFEGLDQDPDIWLRHASKVLAEVMGGVCLALPFQLNRSRLMRLEFHSLGNRRIVAIWIGSGGDVKHQVMDNPWDFPPETLTELGNFATANFRGSTLAGMRKRLLETLREQADEAHQLQVRLSDLAAQMTDASERGAPAVVVAGLGELGRMPEFEDSRRFRALVEAFEEHQRLARLLNAFAEASAREVKLLLGSENPYLQDMPLATAMRTVSFPGEEAITFALVGPLRMNYVRLLGGLSWWSNEINRRLPRSV
ncbi:MAG TPA: heat-inducible transcriptional repressor HrcA [Holophaga sp.]|nr:heat-inducible transcriptional repressor HrcA [Holophaga sp.]HPS68127.1 heat-inducible transcriptional repressor HrcA [Holophaga sp.]